MIFSKVLIDAEELCILYPPPLNMCARSPQRTLSCQLYTPFEIQTEDFH